MDIHKPKPIHGWRDFLKEFGTIVLGVSVALAAEQGVEWLHWRAQVAQARDVIASEIENSVTGAIARVKVAPCVERRLDEVTDILDEAARTGRLPPLGLIGQAPVLLWPTGAWESVVASQTATHFPREELAQLARLYKLVERAEGFNVLEREAWSSLYTMVGPGRRLDPASEAKLREALSMARFSNRMLLTSVASLMDAAGRENLPFSKTDLENIGRVKRAPTTSSKTSSTYSIGMALICDPIGPVPPRYGQSQNTYYSVDQYGEILRSVPDFGDGAKIPSGR